MLSQKVNGSPQTILNKFRINYILKMIMKYAHRIKRKTKRAGDMEAIQKGCLWLIWIFVRSTKANL